MLLSDEREVVLDAVVQRFESADLLLGQFQQIQALHSGRLGLQLGGENFGVVGEGGEDDGFQGAEAGHHLLVVSVALSGGSGLNGLAHEHIQLELLLVAGRQREVLSVGPQEIHVFPVLLRLPVVALLLFASLSRSPRTWLLSRVGGSWPGQLDRRGQGFLFHVAAHCLLLQTQ